MSSHCIERDIEVIGNFLVCAQHGRSSKGVQVHCVKTEMKRNEQISTSRSQEGAGGFETERWRCEIRKSMDKNPGGSRRDLLAVARVVAELNDEAGPDLAV
jgi:hypothetical protein